MPITAFYDLYLVPGGFLYLLWSAKRIWIPGHCTGYPGIIHLAPEMAVEKIRFMLSAQVDNGGDCLSSSLPIIRDMKTRRMIRPT